MVIMSNKKIDKAEKHESSKKWLLDNIKEKETIYYCVTRVSQSGMSRDIKFMYHDGKRLLNLSGFFSELCDYKWNGNGSIRVGGCGMDMGFHVISSVARTLFGDYKKLNYEAI
tara:strand:+ start:211 stop:549 length:339 start_codon:yes stop_codon:yes gene_type:complete